jgi:hypothetical protein
MSNLNAQLTMQAYERLVTFIERAGFPALLDRLPAGTLSATQLSVVFKEAIRTEFEHNLSQQIYIAEGSWQAICDMKDQQLFILTQLSLTLSPNASGSDLTKAIQDFLAADPNASIQPMVLDLIRNEAKKVLSRL